MAFSSSLRNSREGVRLLVRADTGQAKQEITELGRQVELTMQGMTKEQIRLDKATKNYQSTLARYGSTHEKTKNAAIRLKTAEEQLGNSLRRNEVQVRRTGHAMDGSHRSLGRLTRGAIAGSGVFQALGRSMAFASAGFIGATGFVYGARAALSAASDLNEQVNKTKEVFEESAGSVMAFSNDALLLSQRQALETSSTLGALLKAMGLLGPEAAQQSIALTKLGVDLSSFYNTSVEDSLAAIQSALVGQVRPLRRYGAEVSAAREKTVAMAMTGKTVAAELTREERVRARLLIIFKDTKVAQGDAARTIDGLANQQRSLTANLEDMAAVIGESLIPSAEKLLRRLNEWLGDSENQKRVQDDVNKTLEVAGGLISNLAKGFGHARKVLDPLVESLGGLERAIGLAFGAAALLKVRKWAFGVGLIGRSAQVAAAQVVTSAATMETALDVATRPRNIWVGFSGPGAKGLGLLGAATVVGVEAYMITGAPKGSSQRNATTAGAVVGAVAGAPLGPQASAALSVLVAFLGNQFGKALDDINPKIIEKKALAQLAKAGLTKKQQMWWKEGFIRAIYMGYTPEQAILSANAYVTKKAQASVKAPDPTTPAGKAAQEAARKRAGNIKRAQTRISALEVEGEKAQRNETLTDDISVAKRKAAQFKIIAANTRGSAEVVNSARRDYENALNDVYNLEKRQADDAEAAAKQRAAERKQREAAAEARRKEAARSYRAALAAKETRLETAVEGATTLKGLRKKRAALIAFYRARINDKKLTDKEHAKYEAELQKTVKGAINDELDLREKTLKRRVVETKLTDGQADDKIAGDNLIAFYAARAKQAGKNKKMVEFWLKKKADAQLALQRLMKKDKQKDKQKDFTASMLAMQFLETRADFFSSFGGNAFTGAAGARQTGTGPVNATTAGTTVTVNQNFTSSPDDTARAARYTKFAMDSVMD